MIQLLIKLLWALNLGLAYILSLLPGQQFVILAYWQVFFNKQNFSLTPLLKLQLNQLTEALFHFCSHKVAILILICYFCLFSLHQAVSLLL